MFVESVEMPTRPETLTAVPTNVSGQIRLTWIAPASNGGSAVRDYVAGTGALIELSGKDAHRTFYGDLLGRFEIRDVRSMHLVVSDWYVFAELRVTADQRDGSGTVAFHTAEFHVPARDGRFIARIGHGTDPV